MTIDPVWAALQEPGELVSIDGSAVLGDLFTIAEFAESIACGGVTDDFGVGNWATGSKYLNSTWVPARFFSDNGVTPPNWATHVLWFNHDRLYQ